MPTIGLELKISRIIAHMRAKDVARDAGIKPWKLSCIENGQVLPTPDLEATLKRIVGWKPAIALLLAQLLAPSTDTGALPDGEPHP
jgi:hypothetical protein